MPIYNCHLCCKIYTNSTQYDEHIKICTEQSNYEKGKMTLNQVSKLVVELYEKVKILEKEREHDKMRIDSLETLVKKYNRQTKTNTIKILNLSQPEIGFIEWLKTITITEEQLDTIFKFSLKDGIIQSMKDAFINKQTPIPIQSLNNTLQNAIFIYDKDESGIYTWKKMSNDDFILFVNAIHKLIKHKYFIEDHSSESNDDIREDIEIKYEKDVKMLGKLSQIDILEIRKRCFDRLRS